MSGHKDTRGLPAFPSPKITRWGYALFGALALVMASGGVVTWWELRASETFMKDATLSEARMIAGAINPERVMHLAGTEADLASPDYQRLRNQLIAIRSANPRFRYLYLMGRRPGSHPFFFMGTAPDGAPDYSPPGQEYYEEAPFLSRVFDTEVPAVSDPVTDRWGRWVSALVPIRHPASGALMAVFGMDIDAAQWRDEILRRTMIPAGITLFVALMVIALFAHFRYRHIRQVRDELQQSEDRWRSLVQGFGDVVSIHDATGNILYISPSARSTLGYPPESLIGSSPFDYTHPEDLDSIQGAFASVYAQTNDNSPTLFRFRHADGHYVHLESLGRNMMDHPGIGGVAIVSRDVSERIRAETALRESEEQLRQAQKMDVVGQLAGGISHDFNNMLGGISGYAEILRMKLPKESPLQKHVGAILKGADRASDLTKKLLAFARKGKVVSTPLDIHEVIRSAMDLLERSIDRRIHVVSRFEAAASMVVGDPTLLQNAFLNLGINARDAMPEGGTLTFVTANLILDETFCNTHPYSLEPGPFIEIDVIDTGEGISRDLMPRIFEPFFTTKPVGKGTGLGLSAVYGTVKEHRGGINVYSEPGMGTVFKIYLPVDLLGQDSIRPLDELIIPGHGCILVVDDESIIRNMASELLMTLGYDVLLAEDGEAAVEIYRREQSRISLVLLDMVMPKISGRETFFRMRAIDPDARILFSSGFTREGGVGELLALGAAGFVQKPYRLSVLSKAIADAVGRG